MEEYTKEFALSFEAVAEALGNLFGAVENIEGMKNLMAGLGINLEGISGGITVGSEDLGIAQGGVAQQTDVPQLG